MDMETMYEHMKSFLRGCGLGFGEKDRVRVYAWQGRLRFDFTDETGTLHSRTFPFQGTSPADGITSRTTSEKE